MKLLMLLLITLLPAVAIFDADDYIAKLYKPLTPELKAFEQASFSSKDYQQVINPWLNALEAKLPTANLDASFLFYVDSQGHISNLELEDGNFNAAALRDFIAQLTALRLPPRPKLADGLRLRLETKYMVISRNYELEPQQDFLAMNFKPQANLVQPLAAGIYEATLINPEFFTAPRVGEKISFSVAEQIYLGTVIDSGKDIVIVTDAIKQGGEIFQQQAQYWRLATKDSRHTADSMLAAAASAGLGLSMASHGIANVTLASLAGIGSRLGSGELGIDAGGKFSINKLGNRGGVKICKQ